MADNGETSKEPSASALKKAAKQAKIAAEKSSKAAARAAMPVGALSPSPSNLIYLRDQWEAKRQMILLV
jgi:hypothetical protein